MKGWVGAGSQWGLLGKRSWAEASSVRRAFRSREQQVPRPCVGPGPGMFQEPEGNWGGCEGRTGAGKEDPSQSLPLSYSRQDGKPVGALGRRRAA